MVARIDSSRNAYYYLHDHLGTTRMISNASGATCYDADFFPWGQEQAIYTNSCSQNYKFTGKEHDPNSGLDFFEARWYASSLGSFLTTDWSANPEPVPYVKLDNPQTLNLYAYVVNNPLSKTDPSGHYECSGDKAQCAAISDALAAIRAASTKLNAGSSGKKLLDKVLRFYGDEGEKNGVKVNFSSTDPGSLGSTGTKNGITTISFGTNTFSSMKEPGKSETVAHEGAHGVDQQRKGMPQTFWQFYDTEYHAYQAESAVDKGLGLANETDKYPVWFPGITPQQRITNITRDAYSNACYDVGGCQ